MAVRLAVFGNINMDFVLRVPRFPRPGETLGLEEVVLVPGGKAANQAVAAARLGAEVFMAGCVGADALGDELLARLAENAVDVSFISRAPDRRSGMAFIAVTPDGEGAAPRASAALPRRSVEPSARGIRQLADCPAAGNAIYSAFGANLAFTPDRFREALGVLENVQAVLVQLAIPVETVEAVIAESCARDLPVFLDPTPLWGRLPENWPQAHVLSPNATEAATLLNAEVPEDPSTAEGMVRDLLAAGPEVVALKLGASGSLVGWGGGLARVKPFAVHAVDPTAAGDAFLAALAVARLEGRGWVDAARFANAAGALACTKLGAQSSLPTRDEVEALMVRGA